MLPHQARVEPLESYLLAYTLTIIVLNWTTPVCIINYSLFATHPLPLTPLPLTPLPLTPYHSPSSSNNKVYYKVIMYVRRLLNWCVISDVVHDDVLEPYINVFITVLASVRLSCTVGFILLCCNHIHIHTIGLILH